MQIQKDIEKLLNSKIYLCLAQILVHQSRRQMLEAAANTAAGCILDD